MPLQFVEQVNSLGVHRAPLYGSRTGAGTKMPAVSAVQDGCQVLRLLDRLNLEAPRFAVAGSGDRDHSFVCTVKQTATDMDQGYVLETSHERLSDALGIVCLLDCLRDKHRKPAVLRDKAERMNQEISPCACRRRKTYTRRIHGRSTCVSSGPFEPMVTDVRRIADNSPEWRAT